MNYEFSDPKMEKLSVEKCKQTRATISTKAVYDRTLEIVVEIGRAYFFLKLNAIK